MTTSEKDRRNLFNDLEAALGGEAANNLMELLPHIPASELATRADVAAMGSSLRGEMAELRGELRSEMAELRGEMGQLRGELRAEMATGFAVAKVETQRLIVAGMAANAVAVITALVA